MPTLAPRRSVSTANGLFPGDRAGWWLGPYVWAGIAAAIVGVMLSVFAWFALSDREHRLAELELRERAISHAGVLQNGINDYLGKLAALRALFQSSNKEVARGEFAAFSELILRDQTAIKHVSWIPRVGREQRAAIEDAAIRDGVSEFHIKAVAPDGSLAPSTEKDEYYPILFIFSTQMSITSPVYGIDLNSEVMRRQAVERARDNDQPATSSVINLQGGVGDRRGFLVMLPVYKYGLPHDTVETRRQNLVGLIQGTFQLSVMIESHLATSVHGGELDLYLFAPEAADDAFPVHFHAARRRTAPIEQQRRASLTSGPHWSGGITVGDARWTVIAVPMPDGLGRPGHYGAWMALAGGLCVTAAAVAYIWASGRRSVAALRSANETLRTQNVRFDTALSNMLQGLLMFDSDEQIVLCNDRFIEMYGLSREIVKPGCSLGDLLRHRAETGELKRDIEQYRAELQKALARGAVTAYVVETPDGRAISIANKPMIEGGCVVTHEDITERLQTEAQLSHLALHDRLTDLPNRHFFREQIEYCLVHLARHQMFALLCMGLDHFKGVNSTLGHPVGDKLLRQVGDRLRGCLSESDILSRLGGDEFAILAGSVVSPLDTTALIARVVKVMSEPFDLDGHQVVIGASIGIAVAPADGTDADQLLKNAGMALYRAKAEGRGACRFFEPAMDARMQARHGLELDLRKALSNGEFELYYQPLVHLEGGRISGCEALIRWNHPERKMVSPAEFIPIAEETGLIGPIGEWVLRQGCDEAARWPDEVSLAVNLSPTQFKTTDLAQTVIDALERSGLAPDRLQLEITEAVLLNNSDATLATLHQLRALGVSISMDDFGTGYSSLSYLRSFPFDKIKIDQSFVHDLSWSKDAVAIVRAVVGLGRSLGMATTAEGIETAEELEHLKREGCTEGQGYFFSKPQPAENVRILLARQSAKTEAVA
jgi:diguanylate cyclase (GGDEF)-like protein/PAS domain S-box-containing protein